MTGQFHNTFKTSADAIHAILDLHFPEGSILDVNYGLGVFYSKVDRDVTGVDIRTPADILADNKALPLMSDSFDIGVLDPPYKRGNGNKRYTSRYGEAPYTEQRSTQSYLAALPELFRVCRRGLIIKCQDASDGHTFYARHVQLMNWIQKETGLVVHDIAANARWSVCNANTQGQRRFFQQSISYFLIYKWRSKNPFKPVRF